MILDIIHRLKLTNHDTSVGLPSFFHRYEASNTADVGYGTTHNRSHGPDDRGALIVLHPPLK